MCAQATSFGSFSSPSNCQLLVMPNALEDLKKQAMQRVLKINDLEGVFAECLKQCGDTFQEWCDPSLALLQKAVKATDFETSRMQTLVEAGGVGFESLSNTAWELIVGDFRDALTELARERQELQSKHSFTSKDLQSYKTKARAQQRAIEVERLEGMCKECLHKCGGERSQLSSENLIWLQDKARVTEFSVQMETLSEADPSRDLSEDEWLLIRADFEEVMAALSSEKESIMSQHNLTPLQVQVLVVETEVQKIESGITSLQRRIESAGGGEFEIRIPDATDQPSVLMRKSELEASLEESRKRLQQTQSCLKLKRRRVSKEEQQKAEIATCSLALASPSNPGTSLVEESPAVANTIDASQASEAARLQHSVSGQPVDFMPLNTVLRAKPLSATTAGLLIAHRDNTKKDGSKRYEFELATDSAQIVVMGWRDLGDMLERIVTTHYRAPVVVGPIKYGEFRSQPQLTMLKGCTLSPMLNPPMSISQAKPQYAPLESLPEKADYTRVHVLFIVGSAEDANPASGNVSARRSIRVCNERGTAVNVTVWDTCAVLDIWTRGNQIEVMYGTVNRDKELLEVNDKSFVQKVKQLSESEVPSQLQMCQWAAYSRGASSASQPH